MTNDDRNGGTVGRLAARWHGFLGILPLSCCACAQGKERPRSGCCNQALYIVHRHVAKAALNSRGTSCPDIFIGASMRHWHEEGSLRLRHAHAAIGARLNTGTARNIISISACFLHVENIFFAARRLSLTYHLSVRNIAHAANKSTPRPAIIPVYLPVICRRSMCQLRHLPLACGYASAQLSAAGFAATSMAAINTSASAFCAA